MKVAVLMGGNSSEWEISLNTGKAVVEAFREMGWDVHPCPYKDDLTPVVPALKAADIVFNALHGGEGENGSVQRILEEHGIRYTGSGPEASSLAMDKQKSKLLFAEHGIPTPPWILLQTSDDGKEEMGEGDLGYPIVVKPRADGSTMGVSLVKDPNDFDAAVELAREFGSDVIVEEYIPGREIAVVILGAAALPAIEIIPSHELYDYTCKYTEGMSRYVCPADLPAQLTNEVHATAEKISELMNCLHYCRVDFRLNANGEFFCLEVNTLPGLTGTSLVPKAAGAAGISFEELMKRIVNAAYGDE